MPEPKGNKNAAGNKGGGRKPKYKKEYAEWAEKLCKLGATDKDLANAFGVSEMAINRWKKIYIEFQLALKDGKEHADANVADRLYQRAMGYTHPEEKIFNHNGEIVRANTIKHYPPDTTAAIFWLKNRRKDQWRDKHDHEHTGKDGKPIETDNKWTVEFVNADKGDRGEE